MAKSKKTFEHGRKFFSDLAKKGVFSSVFLIYGAERFLVDEAVSRIIKTVFPEKRDDFNYSLMQANKVTGIDVVAAAETSPMFAKKRIVLVQDFHEMKAQNLNAIAAYVKNPLSSTVLILEAKKVEKRSKAIKTILNSKNVTVVEYPLLFERDVEKWIPKQAQRKKLILAKQVPRYLIDAVGPELLDLDLALQRIELYLGGKQDKNRVSLAIAKEIIPDTRVRNVFELVEALSQKHLDDSLRFFSRMLKHGENSIKINAMIAYQFRQIWLTQDGIQRGLSGYDLAKYVGVPVFRLETYLPTARRFSAIRLKEITQMVAATDQALKSSRLADRIHVERLFVKICS